MWKPLTKTLLHTLFTKTEQMYWKWEKLFTLEAGTDCQIVISITSTIYFCPLLAFLIFNDFQLT